MPSPRTLDLLICIPLVWGAWNGYRKGLLVEITAVVAFVVAMLVGFRFIGFGIDLLSPYISRELARKLLPWLGFSVIFFPTVLLVNQIGYASRRWLRQSLLGTADRLAGATMGVFTWVFGISVVLWLLSFLGVQLPTKHTADTRVYPLIRPVAPLVMDWTVKNYEAGYP